MALGQLRFAPVLSARPGSVKNCATPLWPATVPHRRWLVLASQVVQIVMLVARGRIVMDIPLAVGLDFKG